MMIAWHASRPERITICGGTANDGQRDSRACRGSAPARYQPRACLQVGKNGVASRWPSASLEGRHRSPGGAHGGPRPGTWVGAGAGGMSGSAASWSYLGVIRGRLDAIAEDAGADGDIELAEVAGRARDVIADAIDAHEYVIEPD